MQKASTKKRLVIGGAALITANMIANVLNLIFNVNIGRELSIQNFGELSLFTSLLYLVSVPLGCFSATTSQKIAYLYGKYTKGHARHYFNHIWARSIVIGAVLSVIWFILSPFLSAFFKLDSVNLMLYFAPVWAISFVSANYSGYLKGTLAFGRIAIVALTEAVTRLGAVFILFSLGLHEYTALAIVASFIAEMTAGALLIGRIKDSEISENDKKFNAFFFLTTSLNGISVITFLTLDVILVKHFLSPIEAGQYGLLALVGKMIYFVGSLFAPFMIPLVSHHRGARTDSRKTFLLLFLFTAGISLCAFIGLGLFGRYLVPFVFGDKSLSIIPLLVPYALAMAIFTASQPIVSYFQAKEKYSYAVVGAVVAVFQILATALYHENLTQIVYIMLATSVVNFMLMGVVYLRQRSKYETA